MKSYESEKKGKEKLALYDLKVSLEVAMNAFLSSELAYESLELGCKWRIEIRYSEEETEGAASNVKWKAITISIEYSTGRYEVNFAS